MYKCIFIETVKMQKYFSKSYQNWHKNLRSSVQRGIVYVTEKRRIRKYFNNILATSQEVLARMCLAMNIWQTTHSCTHTDLTPKIWIPHNQKLKSFLLSFLIFLIFNSYQSKSHFFTGKKNLENILTRKSVIHMKTIQV